MIVFLKIPLKWHIKCNLAALSLTRLAIAASLFVSPPSTQARLIAFDKNTEWLTVGSYYVENY